MNQIKIGKFIAKCRKDKNLTQQELADRLNITYKAVSKWECGKGLPDAAIMINLCNILEISVNELLTGEKLKEDSYKENAELNLININRKKELIEKTTRITHILTILLLLLINITNVINYGVEITISKPEFIIMNLITFIFFTTYICLYDKIKK